MKSRVGSMKWRTETLQLTGEADKMTKKIEQHCTQALRNNIQSGARDSLTQLSNKQASKSFRAIRQSSNVARECLIDVNEQIRSMCRATENIVKIEGIIYKALEKSKRCDLIRSQRPKKEKVIDNADLLLQAECQKLKEIEESFKKLKKKVTECSEVLSDKRTQLNQYIVYQSKFLTLVPDNTLPTNNPDVMNADEDDGLSGVLEEVKAHIEVCRQTRKQVQEFANSFNETHKMIVSDVDVALKEKIKETQEFKTSIKKARQQNKMAVNKSVSLFHRTQHSWLDIKGAENSAHTNTSEQKNRPLLRTLRQPGQQNLEQKQLQQGSDGLLSSMKQTLGNIENLRWMEEKLKEEEISKSNAMSVDRLVSVARRKK